MGVRREDILVEVGLSERMTFELRSEIETKDRWVEEGRASLEAGKGLEM